jgi:hypothetical protein
MVEIPFQVVVYAVVVGGDVERHRSELEARRMEYDGEYADMVGVGIEEASFVVVLIRGEKGEIRHHHHHHHHPFPFLCHNH